MQDASYGAPVDPAPPSSAVRTLGNHTIAAMCDTVGFLLDEAKRILDHGGARNSPSEWEHRLLEAAETIHVVILGHAIDREARCGNGMAA